MRWAKKELVPGTRPPIRIGRRIFKSSDGTMKATETFWATFSIGGKQRFVSLEVLKRNAAFREAHPIPATKFCPDATRHILPTFLRRRRSLGVVVVLTLSK
jgi:hypothetical protein